MPQQLDLSQLVMAHGHRTPPLVELSFDIVCFAKFLSLMLVFLLIPFLSLAKLFSNPQSRKPSHRRSFPATYVPPPPIEPFTPLKTRRHFRISHVGNCTGRGAIRSDSESDDEAGEEVVHYKLVWGKRRRGEELEFKGQSAMKGGRERERQRQLAPSSSSPAAIPGPKRSVTIAAITSSHSSISFPPSSPSLALDLFSLPLASSLVGLPSAAIFRSTYMNFAKTSPPLVNSLVYHLKRLTGVPGKQ